MRPSKREAKTPQLNFVYNPTIDDIGRLCLLWIKASKDALGWWIFQVINGSFVASNRSLLVV